MTILQTCGCVYAMNLNSNKRNCTSEKARDEKQQINFKSTHGNFLKMLSSTQRLVKTWLCDVNFSACAKSK